MLSIFFFAVLMKNERDKRYYQLHTMELELRNEPVIFMLL